MKKQNLNSILLMYINYIINYFNNIHKNQLKKTELQNMNIYINF